MGLSLGLLSDLAASLEFSFGKHVQRTASNMRRAVGTEGADA